MQVSPYSHFPQRLAILGSSHATLAMLLDAIYAVQRECGQVCKVEIIQNIALTEMLPYEVPDVDTTVLPHDAWQVPADPKCLPGVYKPAVKEKLVAFFQENFGIQTEQYINLVHPRADVASTVSMGKGIFINPLAAIAPYSVLGDFVTINRSASVGHHSRIGAFATINPGAHIAGNCQIGSGTTVGMGASIIDGVEVGENTIIGAGALVTKNIPANVKAFGVPARIIGDI